MEVNDFLLTYFFIYLILSYKLKINPPNLNIINQVFTEKKIFLFIFRSINYTT